MTYARALSLPFIITASHSVNGADAPPPSISIRNGISGDDLFNVTLGAPGSCSCESPKCEQGPQGTLIRNGESRGYAAASGCDYFAVGGGITSKADGEICNTWRADYKSCAVYPGSTSGSCGRLVSPACTLAGTTTTLHATIDRKCDVLQWRDCNATSVCCGHNTCKLVSPGKSPERMCQP